MSGGTRCAGGARRGGAGAGRCCPRPRSARLRWSGCGDVEAECARVPVPLDRSGAVNGSVRLRLARYTAPSAKPTLLYLSGGPGGAGVREFADVLFEVEPLSRRYQLVSYDQRGTGYSGLIRCRVARARRAAALDARWGGVRDAAGRAARALRHRRLGRGRRGAAAGAGRGEADAVRDLLRHEARARLRARPPGPRRAARARLRARSRRRRRLRPRALPGDGALAGGAVPGALPWRERRPGCGSRAARRPLRGAPLRGTVYGMRGRKRPATLTALGSPT